MGPDEVDMAVLSKLETQAPGTFAVVFPQQICKIANSQCFCGHCVEQQNSRAYQRQATSIYACFSDSYLPVVGYLHSRYLSSGAEEFSNLIFSKLSGARLCFIAKKEW